jgi:uncharacterized protein with von Willebrand factor type A (vWA) domain
LSARSAPPTITSEPSARAARLAAAIRMKKTDLRKRACKVMAAMGELENTRSLPEYDIII